MMIIDCLPNMNYSEIENNTIPLDKKHIGMNHISNLVPLCDSCHDKLHNGQLKINGYKETSRGVMLDFI
jgi:hypothetical protein